MEESDGLHQWHALLVGLNLRASVTTAASLNMNGNRQLTGYLFSVHQETMQEDKEKDEFNSTIHDPKFI